MFGMKLNSIVAALIVLSGCETSSNSRLCNGFNHPAAAVWTENNGEGEVRSFVDDAGTGKQYTLTSIRKSGPEKQTDDRATGDDDVRCFESAEYVYADADIGFVFQFTQVENGINQALEEQRIELEVEVQNPLGVDIDTQLNPVFRLRDLESNNLDSVSDGNTYPREHRYIPSETINGDLYTDLLQHTFLDNTGRFSDGRVAEEAQWVRVLLAKDVGLVQYELLNGTVYSLTRD